MVIPSDIFLVELIDTFLRSFDIIARYNELLYKTEYALRKRLSSLCSNCKRRRHVSMFSNIVLFTHLYIIWRSHRHSLSLKTKREREREKSLFKQLLMLLIISTQKQRRRKNLRRDDLTLQSIKAHIHLEINNQ